MNLNPTLIGSILAVVLTLMVFSYLLGNNPLYRLAQHIFVGVSVGYAALLLLGNVLVPQIFAFQQAQSGSLGGWLAGLPILFGLILLFRVVRPGATDGQIRLPVLLGTLVLNIAISTLAALAIGGALTGTIVPQVAAGMQPVAGDPISLINSLIVALGTVTALYYFQFTVRANGTRSPASSAVAAIGRWVIVITLGVTLGTLTVSFVSALVDRVAFLFNPF